MSTQAVTSLTYYLTEACNLRCTYCYVDKQPKRSSLEVGRAALEFLFRESEGETNLHLRFFGGEPMIELGLIEELVEYGRSRASDLGKSIRFDMISNATLAKPETVARLERLGVAVIASVDGSRRTMEQNRPFFVLREGFDGFEDKLRHLVSSGVGRVARMTVSPGDTDVVNNLEYLLSIGYESIMMTTANNVPWKEETVEGIYRQVGRLYVDKARAGRILPLIATNQLLLARHEREQGTHVPPSSGFCSAGKEMLGVSVSGDLYPCHRFVQMGESFRLGNVFEGIDEAKRRPYTEVTTETLHHEKCESCHALPYCPGSCMAANLPDSGDAYYPESRHCIDLRAHVRAVEEIYETLTSEGCDTFLEFIDAEWRKKRRQLLLSLLEEAAPAAEAQAT